MTGIKNNKVRWEAGDTKMQLSRVETLIVWTESNGTDMALSFQEAEGCAAIWWVLCSEGQIQKLTPRRDFVSQVQQQLLQLAGPGMHPYVNPLLRLC